jgi:hypothetical protein
MITGKITNYYNYLCIAIFTIILRRKAYQIWGTGIIIYKNKFCIGSLICAGTPLITIWATLSFLGVEDGGNP